MPDDASSGLTALDAARRAQASPAADRYDPTYLHARREALLILVVWAACLAWVVPYCYLNGYLRPGESFQAGELQTILGMPRWVFFGIAVPWLVADLFTVWFCFFYMRDDDLGEAPEESSAPRRQADEVH